MQVFVNNNTNAQRFRIIRNAQGHRQIMPLAASSRAMEVQDGNHNPGAVVALWTYEGLTHMHWVFQQSTVANVIYRGNGHTSGNVPAVQTLYTPGSFVVSQSGTMARTGHRFGSWRTQNGETWQPGVVAGWGGVAGGSAVFLDAIWLPITTVTIVYRGSGHTNGNLPANQTVNTPGSVVIRQHGTMGRTGYRFGGWRVIGGPNNGEIWPAGSTTTWNNSASGT